MRKCIALAVVLWLLLALPQGVYSEALPKIEANYTSFMVDDELFTGGFHVSLSEIEEFIEDKGEECDGDLCLKDYEDADDGRSVAVIIHDSAREYAVNPYVILATLQKETALVTSEGPEEWQYQTAMGYGCPDDADCEEDYFGFANQIELGTALLRVSYDRACGDPISRLQWWVHPRINRGYTIDIDTEPTYLGNCATASLYNYTPHRVDSAWEPYDGSYYYGNYNFVLIFHDWYPYAEPVESIE